MNTLYTMAPVFNLRIGEDVIPLDSDAFRLERCALHQDEIPLEVKNGVGWDQWEWLAGSVMTWIIIPRTELLSKAAAREDVDLIVTAIRLLKDRPVWVPIFWTGSRKRDPVDTVLEGADVSYFPDRWLAADETGIPVHRYDETTCEIGSREIGKVKELLRQLRALPLSHRRLAVALKRFNMALDRNSREDGIIDLCIALEAALGQPNIEDVGGYLEKKAASILTDAGSRQREHTLADHYWVRNQIVHSTGAGFDSWQTLTELAADARRVLRRLVLEPDLARIVIDE